MNFSVNSRRIWTDFAQGARDGGRLDDQMFRACFPTHLCRLRRRRPRDARGAGRLSCRAGFSLVEILVAFSVFALAMAGAFSASLQASRLGDSARLRIELLQHARTQVEVLQTSRYGAAALAPGTYAIARGGFDGEYVVAEQAGSSGNARSVLVRMNGVSAGRLITVELRTLVSRGLNG